MIELSLAEVATICGGELVGGASGDERVTGSVEFDSRKVTDGGLFVALPGERVDGHDYVATARAAGAVAALVTRDVGAPAVRVADPLAALAALATEVLSRLPETVVVGVTGSSGKTSTKDLLAHLLSRLGTTVAPPESFNNELGHPYTVLRANTETRYLVLEYSARKVGHIASLAEIAPPRLAAVLNVGSAHLGEFGSTDNIAKAKSELVQALPAAADGGVAILNADDPRVAAMADVTAGRVVRVGRRRPEVDLRADDVTATVDGRPEFRLVRPETGESVSVQLRLYGEHHVDNALIAAAAAAELGMSLPAIGAALSEAGLVSRRRMEVTTTGDGVTVVDDTFNANPDSVRAALRAVAVMAKEGERAASRRWWVVLGEMAELGDTAADEHAAVGRLAVELGADRVIGVGAGGADVERGAAEAIGGGAGSAVAVADTAAASELLGNQVRTGDVVLVKGSKVAHMERVTAALIDGTATSRETAK